MMQVLRKSYKPNQRITILFALIFISIFLSSTCYSEIKVTRAVKSEVKKRILNSEITIVPILNKLTVGFGRNESGTFYFVKTPSKIFFQDKLLNVKVKDIDYENDGVILYLWNDVLGRGKIRFIFSREGKHYLTVDEIDDALKFSLADENNLSVFVDSRNKTFHLYTSNHLPVAHHLEKMSTSDAVSKGNKPCGYCFIKLTYIPNQDLEYRLAQQGAAAQRYMKPLVIDQNIQKYIQGLGNRVLNKWPIPLIGYKYRFQVVDGVMPNAMALPAGHIMVTSKLLDSIINEEEIEAVLAHEIGHVERKHVLRNYYLELEKQQTKQAIAAIGGAVAAGAAARNNQSVAVGALSVAIVGALAMDVYYAGYPKEFEREADDLAILYFNANKMDKKHLINIFKKFEFLNLATFLNPDPYSLSHPYLAERISRVEQANIIIFNNETFIYSSRERPDIQIDLLYQSEVNGKSYIEAYIHNFNFIYEGLTEYSNHGTVFIIVDNNTTHMFKINAMVRDTWGAHIRLEGYNDMIIGNVKSMAIQFSKGGFSDADLDLVSHDKTYKFKEKKAL